MATRKLRIDLEIDVRDLTLTEMAEAGVDFMEGDEEDDLRPEHDPDYSEVMSETGPFDLAEIIVGMFHDEAITEAFAGSNRFVTFVGEPLVIASEWVPERA